MIQLIGNDARTVPNWFRTRLRHVDSALVVYFNPFREQFVIDRCVKGSDCLSPDHLSCEKTTVMLFPHIGEAVFEKLQGMDAWNRYGSLDNMRKERENQKAAYDQKVLDDSRAEYRNAMLDDKRQIREALMLIQRHDVARPNK